MGNTSSFLVDFPTVKDVGFGGGVSNLKNLTNIMNTGVIFGEKQVTKPNFLLILGGEVGSNYHLQQRTDEVTSDFCQKYQLY